MSVWLTTTITNSYYDHTYWAFILKPKQKQVVWNIRPTIEQVKDRRKRKQNVKEGRGKQI